MFRLHMNGPSQNPFDFGDAGGGLYNSAAGSFMGYAQVRTSTPAARALFAYEARRLAEILGGGGEGWGRSSFRPTNCGASLGSLDCARLLIEFSSDGSHADLVAEPTARVFRMSAFGWGGRRAVGFLRSGWAPEDAGTASNASWLAFKAP